MTVHQEILILQLENFGNICYETVKNNKCKNKGHSVFTVHNTHSRDIYNYLFNILQQYMKHISDTQRVIPTQHQLGLKVYFPIHGYDEELYILIDQLGDDTRIVLTTS